MKKLVALVLAGVMAFSMVACGGQEVIDDEQNPDSGIVEVIDQQEEDVVGEETGDVVVEGDVAVEGEDVAVEGEDAEGEAVEGEVEGEPAEEGAEAGDAVVEDVPAEDAEVENEVPEEAAE